jgi:apocytochrome f
MKSLNLIRYFICLFFIKKASAFPIYAQQAYENPREANGRIACANCHLAQKSVQIEAPQSILSNSLFEAIVKIPYDLNSKQILANGKKGNLNVGAVVILPEGFKMATSNQLTNKIKEKNKGIYISPYNNKSENILVVGPIAGDKNQKISFPIISPDPLTNKNVNFIKYPIYVGANRGRGQINPTGEKTNNNTILAPIDGTISSVTKKLVSIKNDKNTIIEIPIPEGVEIIVAKGSEIYKDQPLTEDPNVGGFGQTETEIVLQSPIRIYGYITLCFFISLTQIFLVIKKKQFEKIQAAEISF